MFTRIVATAQGDTVEMRDTRSGVAMIAPVRYPVAEGFGEGVLTTVRVQQQPTGSDIIVTVQNQSATTQPLGRLRVGIFNMGEQIEYLWSRMNAEMKPADAQTHIGKAWIYPLDLYSPVMVMRNSQRAIGVSLHYPVLEYQHDVRVTMASPGSWAADGEAGRGWLVGFDFRNFGGESVYTRLEHEGTIAAGESRTYVMSVRVTDTPNEWIRTLLPYRDYFRTMYGGVRYERSTTPIRGMNVGDVSHLSDDNQFGFSPHLRPDLRGFGPLVREAAGTGWDSFIFWTPSGLYNRNRQLNWPYHMASTLDSTPQLSTAFSSTEGFPWLTAQGKQVGFWWGRSMEFVPYWDAPSGVALDPSNPQHVTSARRELDAAARAGCTIIGLDTFTPVQTPLWELLPWLEDMEARHPQMKFVTEPSQCDIMHTRAATFYDGWIDIQGTTRNRDDLFHIQSPNVLSDLINPGHESWVGLGYRPSYQRSFGTPTTAQVHADIEELCEWGFRPILFWSTPQPVGMESAPSWEYTLPADIRNSDPYILDLRAGRLPGTGQVTPPTPPSPPTEPVQPSDPTPPTPPTDPQGEDPNEVITIRPTLPPPPTLPGGGSNSGSGINRPIAPQQPQAPTLPPTAPPTTVPPAVPTDPTPESPGDGGTTNLINTGTGNTGTGNTGTGNSPPQSTASTQRSGFRRVIGNQRGGSTQQQRGVTRMLGGATTTTSPQTTLSQPQQTAPSTVTNSVPRVSVPTVPSNDTVREAIARLLSPTRRSGVPALPRGVVRVLPQGGETIASEGQGDGGGSGVGTVTGN